MFKTIEPHRQCYYQASIDLFMGLMKLQQNLCFSQEEQQAATFILAEEKVGDVYGGAFLYRRHLYGLHPRVRSLFSKFAPNEEWVWECTVFLEPLCLSHASAPDRAQFMQIFYKKLLEKLSEFGNQQGIGFLCLTLNPVECLRIRKRSFWPWVLEINPNESLDSFFHGVLSLRGDERKDCDKAKKSQLLKPSFPTQGAI